MIWYDIYGRVVKSYRLQATQNEFNIFDLQSGVYSLRMNGNGDIHNTKFVVQ